MAATQQDLDSQVAAVNQKATDAVNRVNQYQTAQIAASATLKASVDSLTAKIADLTQQLAAVGSPVQTDFSAEIASLAAVAQTIDTLDPAPAQAAPLSPADASPDPAPPS